MNRVGKFEITGKITKGTGATKETMGEREWLTAGGTFQEKEKSACYVTISGTTHRSEKEGIMTGNPVGSLDVSLLRDHLQLSSGSGSRRIRMS